MIRGNRQGGKRLSEVLGAEPAVAGWMERAQRDARLGGIIARRLPPGLAGAFRVLAFERGELLLGATSGAAAIALRRESMALVSALRAQGVEADTLRTVVVPRAAIAAQSARAGTPRHIAPEGIAALRDLVTRLPEGPLREAVGRLAQQSSERSAGEG